MNASVFPKVFLPPERRKLLQPPARSYHGCSCDDRFTIVSPRSDQRTAKSGEIQSMKLIFHRQPARIVHRVSFPRSVRRLALTFIGVFVCAVDVSSRTSDDENSIYDSNPKHLWNRLHEALFIRTAPGWKSYGIDRLDPLFWSSTKHLLVEPSHRQALAVLDEFLNVHGEKLIGDPLKRAWLQHDLWSLFDWSASPYRGENLVRERQELQRPLAIAIRRLALSRAEIASLPDNYARAETNILLTTLPRGLSQRDGDWVCVGANGSSPVAPEHVSAFGGRSVFLVMLRLPEGRRAAVSYLDQLRSFERPWAYTKQPGAARESLLLNPEIPQFPTNTQWGLVRRMCVIDTEGRVQPTPVTESIQVRRYLEMPPGTNSAIAQRLSFMQAQQFSEFVMSRRLEGLLRAVTKGEKDILFVQLHSGGMDPFEFVVPDGVAIEGPTRLREDELQSNVLQSCSNCHGRPGVQSVLTYNQTFGLTSFRRPPELVDSNPEQEAMVTIQWKHRQFDWGLLQGLWKDFQ